MKRIASIFAALVAVASLATPCGAFAADFATCVTNENVTLTADKLEGGDALFVYTYQEGVTYTFTANNQIKAWVLAVGGGGAGGYGAAASTSKGEGGGGGGGGFVETNGISLAAGTYTIGVGEGGVRATKAAATATAAGDSYVMVGGEYVKLGGDSELVAKGGGTGAEAAAGAGTSGGSGGGGSYNGSETGAGGDATTGQGYAGGKGLYYGGGGGGGGAGGIGSDTPASNKKGGAGGAGRESLITGEAVMYAGGGGGGTSGSARGAGGAGGGGTGGGTGSTTLAVAGTDGLGGGGGGGGTGGTSTTYRRGANGGSGIVIIRVTKIYGEVAPPVAKDLPYNGEDQTIWVLDDECELSADSDSLTQKEVGKYKFTVTPKDGSCWKDSGGSDAPITITWHITKATPVVTVIQDGWIEGSPVATSYDCSIAGAVPTILYSDAQDGSYTETVPAAAGTYWVKAAIEGTDNYYGIETTPQSFRILGAEESPNENLGFYAPLTFPTYVGSGKALLTFSLSGFQYVTKDNETSGLCVCAADGTPYPQTVVWSATGTATVTVEVEAMRSDKVLYLCWGVVEGCSAPTLTPSSMTDAISLSPTHGTRVRDTSKTLHNYVDGLSMPSWRKGETASTPSYAYKIGTPVESYKDKDGNAVASPSEPGTYTLTVTIPEETGTDGFGPYVGASAQTTFKILGETESPLTDGSLKYFAPVTVNSAVDAGCLTVTVPATHDWVAAYNDGKDVRFYDIDGNQYPSALANWVGDGSATFKVQIPALAAGSVFYMCWGETVGKTAPASGTPSGATVSVTVAIGATVSDGSLTLKNWISGLSMSGFRLNVDTPVEPTCTRKIGTVRYEYSKFQTTGFSEYSTSGQMYAGSYYMRAVVDASDTDGYAAATSDPVPFRILDEKESPLDSLAYFTRITATGTSAGKATVAVTLPSTLDYRTIASGGAYIRFCDSDGNVLPSKAATAWATDGTAKFSVELPQFSSPFVFYACWGRVVGQAVPSTSAPTAAAGTAKIDFGTTVRDATKWPLVNHWVKEFAISTTSWAKGDVAKGLVTHTAGDPAYGEFKLLCRDIATDEETVIDTLPDGSGDYELIAIADGGSDGDLVWAALTNTPVEVSITEHNPTISVTREHGAEGRVLLMNTDLTPGSEVYNQGYADNDPSYSTFWEFLKTEQLDPSEYKFYNLSNETESVLWTSNRVNRLWTLVNCRHGNPYDPDDGEKIDKYMNGLPWNSEHARDIDAHESTMHTRHGAGQIVMRNTTNACVYSSCFEEGIGTIYFDAVNGHKTHEFNGKEIFQLQVYFATNCVTSLGEEVDVAPIDDYVFPEGELAPDAVATNANWQSLSVVPVKILDGAIAASLPETEAVVLDIENGGKDNCFYRIIAKADITVPCRFKICRSEYRPQTGSQSNIDDISYFLLLDNIIVSYPAMRASITTYGADDYDTGRTGKRVIGVPMALSEAFPSVSSTDVRARGTVSYLTNSGVENPQTNDFIVSARFNYRWRHLNQSFYHDGQFYSADDGRFASVRLSPKDGYLSTKPLDLPGLPGDIEYWYELVLGAPYYRYVDYSGLGLADAMDEIYTEEIATSPIHAPAGFFGETPSPSGGTNWFVRVREGASQYDRVVLSVDDTTGGKIVREDKQMDLIGDHLWRGFVTVTNRTERNLSFCIIGVNPQTDGATEFDSSGTRNVEFHTMIPLVDITEGPYSGTMGAVGESDVPSRDDSGRLHYLTNVASYVEFQFNDSTRALSVSHADYQDFNKWFSSRWENDASLKFYSSAHETNSTTVATKRYPAKAADGSAPSVIEGFEVTPRTKAAWSEDFQISSAQSLAGYPMNIPFPNGSARTPKGWLAEDGMWVAQKWGMTNSTDFALQMEGRGDGSVTFNLADLPNGLDTISFKARLAQFSEFSDIAWNWETVMRRNYTVAAQACFDEDAKFSNFSGEASVSLFTGYVPGSCAYEYRITVYNVDTSWKEGNSTVNRACCRHAIYKWYVENGAYVSKPLVEFLGMSGEENSWWWNAVNKTPADMVKELPLGKNGTQYSGMYMSFSNEANRVIITAGVSAGSDNKVDGAANFTYQDKDFIQIGCIDEKPAKTFGSFGTLMKNCPGRVLYPRVYEGKTVAIPTDATDAGGGKRWKGKVALLTDTDFKSQRDSLRESLWGLTPGRVQSVDGETWGLDAYTNSTQTVRVSTMPVGSTDNWTELTNVTVSAFSDSLEHTISLQSREQRYVRFSSGGTADDVRTDIVIDNITMTQWCGQSGSVTNASTSYGYADDFYYMGAWISNRVEKSGNKNVTKRVAVLAPRRAEKATSPVGIRSPYIEGFGALAFEFADAGADAAIQVQRWTGSLSYLYARNTDAANADGWEPVTNYTFTAGESGTRTVYTGIRAPSNGVFRIVIPQNKVAEAVAHPEYDPNWAAVTIKNIWCYDEPEFDAHSWWGWNFLTTGWNHGIGNRYAAIDDSVDGAVGILNNTIVKESLVTGDADDYKLNSPFIQSPTFGDRNVGEISFRARAYDPSTPSYVTVWGAKSGDLQKAGSWKAVTNIVVDSRGYVRHTVKCADEDGFAAIRLGVSGVTGIEEEYAMKGADLAVLPATAVCAIVDEIVLRERVKPEVGFRLGYVRPFRTGLEQRTAVPDIASRDQQPLLGEQFGFQAEVEVTGLADEVDLGHTPEVYLSIYPKSEPWGYANWKDAAGAILDIRLEPADETNLVFRSMSTTPSSFTGPYEADQSLGYGMVQYYLTLKYWDKGGDAHTTSIDSKQWQIPSWYQGFEDPNAATDAKFSPFTVLDSVSPGRAWFNEINFSDENGSGANQFVEVCFPAGHDMTGWRIYRYDVWGKQNLLASLGLTTGVPATKDATGGDPNFAFLALTDSSLPVAGADAYWNRDIASCDGLGSSYGFQLVRPSGIIEHQVVVEGNLGSSPWGKNKAGTNVVAQLEERVGGTWSFVGVDTNAAIKSTGVFRNAGVAPDDWNDVMDMTPGMMNCEGQIPDGWFLPPSGTNVWLTLSTSGGLVWFVDGEELATSKTLIVPFNTETNLVFETAPWHQLGSLVRDATNDVAAAAVRSAGIGGTNVWTYAFKETERNSASLQATAAPDADVLVRGGLDPADPYTPAVMNWLLGGTANGEPFEGTEISTNCFFRGLSAGFKPEPLPLKERYWLDIDPTSDDWDLRGGMGEFANLSASVPTVPVVGEVRRNRPAIWPERLTNRVVTVTLMISNKLDNAKSRAPNRLQGLGGEKSDVVGARNWTSETFKVTMSLIKRPEDISEDSQDVSEKYKPMASFVFDANSFGAPDGPNPYAARIEVHDPMSSGSPAYTYNWWLYPSASYGYRWTLEHGLYLKEPDVLKTTNTWDRTWEAHNDY